LSSDEQCPAHHHQARSAEDNPETFAIFAAFCANPLLLLWESNNGLKGVRFKSFNSSEAILTRIVDTAFILPRRD
jgi:hypothetical protein